MRNTERSLADAAFIFGIVFLSSFPYLFPLPSLSSDLMPWAALLSTLYIVLHLNNIFNATNRYVLYVYFPVAFFSVIGAGFSGFTIEAMRGAYPYISLFIMLFALTRLLSSTSRHKALQIALIFSAGLIFFVLFLQFLVGKSFLGSLVGGLHVGTERGYAGLHKEPSFLATTLFFLVLIFDIYFRKPHSLLFLLVSFVIVLFFARSVVGILYFLVFIFFRYILYNRFFTLFLLLIAVILLSLVTIFGATTLYISLSDEFKASWRIFEIYSLLINYGLLDLLHFDASVHDRFWQVFFSIHGFIENYSVPHFFHSWQSYLNDTVGEYPLASTDVVWLSKTDRIFSGYGSALFELGFVGAVFVFSPFVFFRYHGIDKRISFSHSLSLFIIMFSAIPLAFPLYAVYLSVILTRRSQDSSATVGMV